MTPFSAPIQLGEQWSLSGSSSNNPSVQIQSISADTPAKIVTITPHGYATNDYIIIGGTGLFDSTDLKPAWQATVIDALTFTLQGSTGSILGNTGSCAKVFSFAGYSISSQLRAMTDARFTPVVITPSASWLDATKGRWNLNLATAQVDAITNGTLYGDVFVETGSPNSQLLLCSFTSPVTPQVTTTFNP